MTSKQLRERLIYIAMSVFVGWHTVAILVAPMPRNSEMVQSLRRLFEPYLTLFRLDHEWGISHPSSASGRNFNTSSKMPPGSAIPLCRSTK